MLDTPRFIARCCWISCLLSACHRRSVGVSFRVNTFVRSAAAEPRPALKPACVGTELERIVILAWLLRSFTVTIALLNSRFHVDVESS